MFRQVADYSVTTHQLGGNNSFNDALLARLLALKPFKKLRQSSVNWNSSDRDFVSFPPCSELQICEGGCSSSLAFADEFSVVFTRLCPRLWLLRATSRQRSKHLFARCHSVADAPLPGSANTGGAFRFGAGLLSRGGGEESSPAPSERNAKHEHNGKPQLHWMPRNRSATHEQHRQADQIPGSTAGMENRFIEGMSHSRHHATM